MLDTMSTLSDLALTALATTASASAAAAPAASESSALQISTEPIDPIGFIAVTGGLLIAVIISTTAILAGMVTSKQREQTRREVAAYLAEGSITSEDAERLLTTKMGNNC